MATGIELTLTAPQAFVLQAARSVAVGGRATIGALSNDLLEEVRSEAVRQRMDGCIMASLASSKNEGESYRGVARALLKDMQLKSSEYLECAREMQSMLTKLGISTLMRKGLVYDRLCYGGKGIRTFGDIDFFLRPDDADAAVSALNDLGYSQSDDRRDVILRRLCPDHLPRLSARRKQVLVEIDVALNMSWYGSSLWEFAEALLAQRFSHPVKQESTMLMTLSIEEHFIDCCLHLYREGFFEVEGDQRIDGPYPLRIRQFLDVAKLWCLLSDQGKRQVMHILELEELRRVIAWVAYHTDDILGTDLMDELSLTIDPGHAFSWRRNDGAIQSWTGNMTNRSFSATPSSIFLGNRMHRGMVSNVEA